MTKIHHNTLKKAKANGLEIHANAATGDFQVEMKGVILSTAKDPKDALDLAIHELRADTKAKVVKLKPRKAKKPSKRRRVRQDDFEDGEEDDDGEDVSKSVVKRKYRMRYRPHKMTCGDALAQRIRKEFMTLKDPDTKKPRLDWPRFARFAKANDCWDDRYLKLNKGMRRMNVVNRLRTKIEAGEAVKWSA